MTLTGYLPDTHFGNAPSSAFTPALSFWVGGGEMGERIRNHAWALTALGPAQHWPQSLKTIVNLMLNTQHPVIVWWGPGLIQLYNDAYAPLIGSERHPSSLGQGAQECWAEIWPIIGPQIAKVMQGDGGAWHENALVPVTRNGQLKDCWWTYSHSPIAEITALNGIGGVVLITTETTDTMLAQKIRERDSVWRNAPDLFVTVGADGVFQAVNPAWQSVLGHTYDQVIGHPMEEFIWPEDINSSQMALVQALENGNLADFRNRMRHKDGTMRWISWYSAKEGSQLFGYGRDVTREQQQAQALIDSERQLRQSQKMEAVGQLTGGIAHDFNNLLAVMMGSLALLERQLLAVTEGGQMPLKEVHLQRHLSNAQSAGRRAAALTQRLLAFSRQQTIEPAIVDVPTLVKEMVELIGITVGMSVELNFVAPTDTGLAVRADKNQLENALLNLCINARDAMPDGGVLTIESSAVLLGEAAAAAMLVPNMQPGSYVQLKVSDTGCGMGAAVISRAFDPFFTTKPVGMGTGLGLSMIYDFAQQSGGHAQLESTLGKGTRASIYLPRLSADGGAAAHLTGPIAVPYADSTAAFQPAFTQIPLADYVLPIAALVATVAAKKSQRTILVVDDEAIVREFVAEVLTEEGFQVLQAATALEGLQQLRAAVPLVLLITDVSLPGGMNGRQLAEGARDMQPDLQVLFITGFAESTVWRGGQPPPGMQVLVKPFEIDSLIARVAHMLQTAHSP